MVYIKKVETTDPRFSGRENRLVTPGYEKAIPVPDELVICNGCSRNIYPGTGYLVYLGKRELKADQPYDFYCGDCVKRYFPKAKEASGET